MSGTPAHRRTECRMCSELPHFVRYGYSPQTIASDLGMTVPGIVQHIRRYPWLAEQIGPARVAEWARTETVERYW